MAFETNAILQNFPTGASLLTLAAGSGTTPGAWTEVWSSAPGNLTVVGFIFDSSTSHFDVELGVGPNGSEVSIAIQRITGSITSQRLVSLFPVAVHYIASGTRVAMRTRCGSSITAGLQYYEAFTSDNFVDLAASVMDLMPTNAYGVSSFNGVIVTPGTSWSWGSWIEVTSGLAFSIGVYGLAVNLRRPEEYEWEIGIGAASSETTIATFSGGTALSTDTAREHFQLPAVFRVAAGTRIAVRARRDSATAFTGDHGATVMYYGGVGEVDPPDDTGGGGDDDADNPDAGINLCGAETPIPYVEIEKDSGMEVYSNIDVALDGTFKESRVSSFGTITRALSDIHGEFEPAKMSIELIDTNRSLRGLAATNTLLNKLVNVYLTTKAGILASATPRRVMQGVIRGYKPLSGFKFRIDLEDYFGSLVSEFAGSREFPQRTLTLDDFPNLDPTLVGKPVPLLYGLCSDEHLGDSALGVVPVIPTGLRNIGGADWEEFLICAHAVKQIQSVFIPTGGGLSTGTAEPSRTKITTDGVDTMWPGQPFWNANFSDPYREFNGNRYTVMYMRGPRATLAADGSVPLALNIAGVEDVGDGSGDLIDSLPRQIQHVIVNWILQTYVSGSWLSVPTIGSPAYGRVRTTATELVKTISETRLPPDGYIGAFMLAWDGNFLTHRDFLAMASQSCDIQFGINKDGQLFMCTASSGEASVAAWDHINDIIEDSFDTERIFEDLANVVTYRYARRYVEPVATITPETGQYLPTSLQQETPDWLEDNLSLLDATSITNHQESRSFDVSLHLVRDGAVAADVVNQSLARRTNGPHFVSFKLNLCGTILELGDNHTATHPEGPTATGWTDRLLRAERITLNLDDMTVEPYSRDMVGL